MSTSAPLLGEPLPVEFMNTIWADQDGVHDALQTPQQAAAWLVAVADRLDVPVNADPGADPATQMAQTWSFARDLRDALRFLAAEVADDDRPAAASIVNDKQRAVTLLNKAAALAPRWSALQLPAHGARPTLATRTAKSAQDAAISQIADNAIALFSGALGSRLRACNAPGCVLYFVKRHPRREWCSAGCGNRARVARHYQRHNLARA